MNEDTVQQEELEEEPKEEVKEEPKAKEKKEEKQDFSNFTEGLIVALQAGELVIHDVKDHIVTIGPPE